MVQSGYGLDDNRAAAAGCSGLNGNGNHCPSKRTTSHQRQQVIVLSNVAADTLSDAANLCFHCLEEVPSYANLSAKVNGVDQPMCCIGCKAAAEFIEQSGLSRFYQHRERQSHTDFFAQIAKLEDHQLLQGRGDDRASKWHFLDTDEASDYVVKGQEERYLEVSLSGLYCASCSWLISRAIRALSPSLICQIDIDNRKLWLSVPDSKLKLSAVLDTIERLGYRATLIKTDSSSSSNGKAELEAKTQRNAAIRRILVAALGTMQVMTYAVATYFSGIDDTHLAAHVGARLSEFNASSTAMSYEQHRFFLLLSMLVATLVVFYSGKPFFDNAIRDLRYRRLGMDVPVALAIAGAYFPSVYQVLSNSGGHVYFDSAVMFVFFLSLGRYIELRARHKLHGAGDDVQSLLPEQLHLERDGKFIAIAPKRVVTGDRLQLKSGDIVPFDAQLLSGSVRINQALLTGEPRLLTCEQGDSLQAGSEVRYGRAMVRAERSWADSSLAKIQSMLSAAGTEEGAEQGLMDLFGRYFVAFVLLLTGVVASVWLVIDPQRVFDVSLAMLIASCPCAFSLAAPVGRSAAVFALRRVGVLLSASNALDTVRRVDTWLFDKTGTLTRGQPRISHILLEPEQTQGHCMQLVAAMERGSGHVLAGAFSAIDIEPGVSEQLKNIEEHIGQGITAKMAGRQLYLGKPAWVMECISMHKDSSSLSIPDQDSSDRGAIESEIFLASDAGLMARIYLHDDIRATAHSTVSSLLAAGHHIEVLSGDHEGAVTACCDALQLDQFRADQRPEDKLARLQSLHQTGRVVAMVGDGVNDAPGLASADLSIAMANGSDLSINGADIVLLNGNLNHLRTLRDVAHFTAHVTQQNTAWALGYNALVLPLAALGYLNPWIAALGMSCSSLIVVLNSLRIRSRVSRLNVNRVLAIS